MPCRSHPNGDPEQLSTLAEKGIPFMGQPKLWLANGLAGDVICVRPVRLYYSTGNALYRYNIAQNQFQGELDLPSLPQTMKSLFLNNNMFTGEICLTNLPPHLEKFSLSFNRLSGTLDLTSLPSTLKFMGLTCNMFSGIVDLTHLPRSVKKVFLVGNSDLLCRKKHESELRSAVNFGFGA